MTIGPPAPPASPEEVLDVAALIRAASSEDHKATESRGFVTRLMSGELDLDAYTRYLAQLAWVYEALESWERRHDDPSVFVPELERLGPMESDLAALGAGQWRTMHAPLPATEAYVEHLHEIVAERDAVRQLAHHYTRYLGDLSGGQAIAKLVARHYDASEDQLTFYRFDGIGDVVPFKRSYREGINGLRLDAASVDLLVAEVRASFRFNAAIFDDLDEFDAAAA
jgi:heme oxygenase (biliverdin-producing, ferredoxin)